MIVKIGTDRFWVKASNIERWAEILKSLPEQIPSKSKKDIAKDYLHYKVDDSGRIVNADEVYGLFGVEKTNESVAIYGCNFIKKSQDGYELTESAVELVERYKNNDSWEKVLAEQLLKYSVRIRSLAFALMNGGNLYFEEGYMQNMVNAYIEFNNVKYYVFSSNPEETNINTLLKDYSTLSIGCFWGRELDIDDTEEIIISGINKDYPSLGAIGMYLKIPLMLFDYLGWIVERTDGMYLLDKYKIKQDIEQAVYESLVCESNMDDVYILKELIKENIDARGFIPVSIVGASLKNRIGGQTNITDEQWIDQYFITGVNVGRFKIKDHEQGQPRHGRGLLGKKDYQLIKLEIIARGD